jgi:hypothetical protein
MLSVWLSHLQILNQLTDFEETWYERYAIDVY